MRHLLTWFLIAQLVLKSAPSVHYPFRQLYMIQKKRKIT